MTGYIATAIHKNVSIIILLILILKHYHTCIQFQIHLSWKHLPLVHSTSACHAPLDGKVGASSAQPNDEWPCPAREGLAVWEPRQHPLKRRGDKNRGEFLQTIFDACATIKLYFNILFRNFSLCYSYR